MPHHLRVLLSSSAVLKVGRLAREFVVALPIELDKDEWQYKTEKEYLCVRDGEERGFTASEFKAAQADGWEKQYLYYVDKKKKEYLPPSEAEVRGLERADKHPKSTKFGRQNPITERWNSDEQLVLWRSAWADTVNRVLERNGTEERIDHRSHAERGLDEQPTVHEGVEARAMERKGFVSDRCELNRQIKSDNALLRELKAQTNSFDPVELFYARESLRKECEEAAETRIRTASKDIDFWGMASARSAVDGKLDLYSEEQRVKKILWERKQTEREQSRQKKQKDRGYER